MTTRAAVAADRRSHTAELAIVLVSYLMIVLDISIVITALPRMHTDLGFSATGLSWVQNAYTLAFGGLLLFGARAGDLLGRRRTFIAGLALFTAASLAIGLAQSATWLLVARAVQGVGAAVLAPSTLALLTTTSPPRTPAPPPAWSTSPTSSAAPWVWASSSPSSPPPDRTRSTPATGSRTRSRPRSPVAR
jgi:MFS family permease